MVQKSGASTKSSDKSKKDVPMASYEDRLKAVLTRKTQLEESRVAIAKQRMLQSTLKHEKLVAEKRREIERRNMQHNSRIASVLQRKQQILKEDHKRKIEILRRVELKCIKAAETRSKMIGKVSKRKTSLSQAIFHQLDLPKSKFNVSRRSKATTTVPKRLVNSSKTVAPKSPVPMSPKRTRSASGSRVSSSNAAANSCLNDSQRSKTLTRDKRNVTRTSSKEPVRKSEPLSVAAPLKKTSKDMSTGAEAKSHSSDEKETPTRKEKDNSEIEFYKQKMAEHRRAMREKMNANKSSPQSTKIKASPGATAVTKPDTKDLDSSISQILSLTGAATDKIASETSVSEDKVDSDAQKAAEKWEESGVQEPIARLPDVLEADFSGPNSEAQTPGALEEQKLKFFEKEEKLMMDQEKIRADAEKERLREQEEFERMQEERRQAEENERAERRARLEAIMKRTRGGPSGNVPVVTPPVKNEEFENVPEKQDDPERSESLNAEADSRGVLEEKQNCKVREYSREHSVSPEPVVETSSIVLTPSEEGVKCASLVEGHVEPSDESQEKVSPLAFVPTDDEMGLVEKQPEDDLSGGFAGLEDSGISLDPSSGADTQISANFLDDTFDPFAMNEKSDSLLDNAQICQTSSTARDDLNSALGMDSMLLDFSAETSNQVLNQSIQQMSGGYEKVFVTTGDVERFERVVESSGTSREDNLLAELNSLSLEDASVEHA